MERVKLKAEATTTLLNARTAKETVPLAVLLYPGKGRALWVFLTRFGVSRSLRATLRPGKSTTGSCRGR